MKKITLVLLALIITISIYANNINRYEPEVIDSRASALGGCSLLSSTGSNFLFNNPSNLSSLDLKNIQINCRNLSGSHDYNYKLTNSVYERKSSYDYPSQFSLNGLSLSIPVNFSKEINCGLAMGWRTYYDMNYDIEMKTKTYSEGYPESIANSDIESRGGFNTFVVGGGVNLTEKFQLGISLSVPLFSEITREEEHYSAFVNGEERAYYSKDKSETELEGSFLTLSGTYKVSDKISLAMRYREEYKLHIEVENDYEGGIDTNTKDFIAPSELALALAYSPQNNS